MNMRNHGFTRRDIRGGSGTGENIASEHFEEMIGTTELYIYRHLSKKIKGYEPLKAYLESHGCEVMYIANTPTPVGQGYETIKITTKGDQIPAPLLRRAHSWAHQRNLLHMFYKKGVSSINRLTVYL